MYTQKTSDKQHIYPLGKTAVKAYENKVLNGSFLNAGKLLVNVQFTWCYYSTNNIHEKITRFWLVENSAAFP